MTDREEDAGEGQLGWFFWRARAAYPHKTAVIDISQGEERRISFADCNCVQVCNQTGQVGLTGLQSRLM